jgi:hypothetical protein
VNRIQIKWTKEIDSLKNKMIQESQYSVQFQPTEMMNREMLPIQFESIVNRIQMKSMKVKYKMKNMMTQELTIPLNFDRLKR